MEIVLSFVCGVFITLFVLLAIGMNEPVTTVPEWRQLPNHVQTLARWGESTTYYVRKKMALPRRIPGAALLDVPDPPPPPHTAEFIKREWWEKIAEWKPISILLNEITQYLDTLDIVATDEELRRFWEDQWADDPLTFRRAGRHRRDELIEDEAWRERWAAYNTQGWPTLNTTGNAWDLDVERPAICTTPLYGDIPLRSVQDLPEPQLALADAT